MLDLLKEYIRPELVVLIPVLYLVGVGLKKSSIADKLIPMILGGAGIALAGIYLVATSGIQDLRGGMMILYSALTQGILTAGASVYINQLVKQGKKEE